MKGNMTNHVNREGNSGLFHVWLLKRLWNLLMSCWFCHSLKLTLNETFLVPGLWWVIDQWEDRNLLSSQSEASLGQTDACVSDPYKVIKIPGLAHWPAWASVSPTRGICLLIHYDNTSVSNSFSSFILYFHSSTRWDGSLRKMTFILQNWHSLVCLSHSRNVALFSSCPGKFICGISANSLS